MGTMSMPSRLVLLQEEDLNDIHSCLRRPPSMKRPSLAQSQSCRRPLLRLSNPVFISPNLNHVSRLESNLNTHVPPTVCPAPVANPLAAPLTSPFEIAEAVFFPVFAKLPTAPVAAPDTFFPAPPAVDATPFVASPAVFVAPDEAAPTFFVTGADLPPVTLSSPPAQHQQCSASSGMFLSCCLPSAREPRW